MGNIGKTIVGGALMTMTLVTAYADGALLGKATPLTIAHRGDSAHYPENTIKAFKCAVANGADMLEMDIQLTKDKRIIVMHDTTLERTTNGKGRVVDHTLEELKQLDAGAWKAPGFPGLGLMSLDEVMETFKDQIPLNIELKTDSATRSELVDKTLATLDAWGMTGQVILSSFDYQALREIRKRNASILLGVLADTAVGGAPALCRSLGAVAYEPNAASVTAETVQACHDAGILVLPWSSDKDNTPETMDRLIKLGVDGFFANDPALAKTILR